MDYIYKTNHFCMLLLDIIRSTSLNHTFFVAFVFLSGETEEDYFYALKMLKKVLDI
jgi:MULE transposase domain